MNTSNHCCDIGLLKVHCISSFCLPFLSQESREARYSAIRALLEDNIKLRDKSESRFQAFFEREINRLKNEFRDESEVGTMDVCVVFVLFVLFDMLLCVVCCYCKCVICLLHNVLCIVFCVIFAFLIVFLLPDSRTRRRRDN